MISGNQENNKFYLEPHPKHFDFLSDNLIRMYDFIRSYDEDCETPEKGSITSNNVFFKKGVVEKMWRIGYMVYPEFFTRYPQFQIVQLIHDKVQNLCPILRLLHTRPTQFLPEFNVNFTRFGVHKDSVHLSNTIKNPAGALLVPVKNCYHTSTTKWHKIISGEPKIVKSYFDADHCETEIVETLNILQGNPVIIRVDEWHSIDNNSTEDRVVAAWHFEYDRSWEDIKQCVKNLCPHPFIHNNTFFPISKEKINQYLSKYAYKIPDIEKNGSDWEYYIDLRTDGSMNTGAHANSRSPTKNFNWIDSVWEFIPELITWAEELKAFKKLNTVMLMSCNTRVLSHSDLHDTRIPPIDLEYFKQYERVNNIEYSAVKIIFSGGLKIGGVLTPKITNGPLVLEICDPMIHSYDYEDFGERLLILSLTGYR